MSGLVYFSSASGNTHRFLTKLGREARRIPLYTYEPTILADEPYVLIVPTYGGGTPKTAVPKQVIKFLNVVENRDLLRGVIGAGNTNFGRAYGLAADVIAAKCGVPVLYRFEVFGTTEDVQNVSQGLDQFWQQQPTLATT
jgi:protein involved in ribonucleotide reduction